MTTRLAIFKIMALSLMRDRAALAMSFLLPGIVFVIFAAIFSGASGGDLTIRVALADLRADDNSRTFAENLFDQAELMELEGGDNTRAWVLRSVRDGLADVGVVVRAGNQPLTAPAGVGNAQFEIITDPAREIATSMVEGGVQRAFASLLPKRPGTGELTERVSAVSTGAGYTAVAYYPGAVAMMFLLFSALTAAVSYLEERESGLLNRIASGPGGVGIVMDGKFLFLVLQGFLQVGVVFIVAWLVFGVDLLSNIVPWTITTLAAAIAAAGLALAFVTLCRTKKQAETLGNMVVLVLSAIGGSMVPRFLMPAEVQPVGWLTPNTWVLEAYASVFWRDDPLIVLIVPWMVLVAVGGLGLVFARAMATANQRIQ